MTLGRAVNLVYRASGLLRLRRRAVRKLVRLMFIVYTRNDKSFHYYTINPRITQFVTRKNKAGLPPFAQQNQYKRVLDSCLIGPGLSKSLNGQYIIRQDWHQNGKVQSCCVILVFWGLLPKVNIFRGLEGGVFAQLPSSLSSWAPFYPWGFALR